MSISPSEKVMCVKSVPYLYDIYPFYTTKPFNLLPYSSSLSYFSSSISRKVCHFKVIPQLRNLPVWPYNILEWCDQYKIECGLYLDRIIYTCHYTSYLISPDKISLFEMCVFSWIMHEILLLFQTAYSRTLEVQKKYILSANWPYGLYLCMRISSEEG